MLLETEGSGWVCSYCSHIYPETAKKFLCVSMMAWYVKSTISMYFTLCGDLYFGVLNVVVLM